MPMRTVHVSTNRLSHHHRGQLTPVMSLIEPSSHSTRFSKEVGEKCVRFLRSKHNDHMDMSNVLSMSLGSINIDSPTQRHCLPVTKFHIALLYNEEFVRAILEELNEEERKFLLTALIDYKEFNTGDEPSENFDVVSIGEEAAVNWMRDKKCVDTFTFALPLALTMCNASEELIKFMLQKGVNIQQCDMDGNNILHSLVDLSSRHPKRAVEMYNMVIEDLVTDRTGLQKLLLATNKEGLTPLDYAAEQCLPEMMYALINTNGVYKFQYKHCATHVHSLYDVTRDEIHNDERGISLLHNISVATEKQLTRIDDFRLLEREPFASWIRVKELSNLWTTRFWALMWVLYVIFYLSMLIVFGESRQDPAPGYHIAVLIVSYIFLLVEIKGLYVNYPYLKMIFSRLRRGIYPLTLASAYRIFQSLFIITMIISNNLLLFSEFCEEESDGQITLHVINIFCGFMSVMFFTQLSEAMGHYLTVIEKMFVNTVAFLSIWAAIFLAFATSFYLNSVNIKCANNSTSAGPEDAESFSSLTHSIYETFLLVLAVVAPRSWYFESSNSPSLSIAVYVLCLVVNTLILLNLLIAIMNERVVEICKHKHSILKINQLSIYLLIGDRRKSTQQFCKDFKFLKNWTNTHAHFYRSKDGSRIYLHVVERTREC